MDFLSYLYTNGLIEKAQLEELKKDCDNNSEKAGNILIKKRVLPYKEVVHQLSLFINTSN